MTGCAHLRHAAAFVFAVEAAAACAAELRDDLWFFADFDGVAQLDGCAFTDPIPTGRPEKGRFGAGYAFVADGGRCENKFWVVNDPYLLKGFPWCRGTFSCWFRSPEDRLDVGPYTPGFGFCGLWKLHWVWRGDSFRTGPGGEGLLGIKGWSLSPEWRHFAATWSEESLRLYIDGASVAEKARPPLADMREVENPSFRIGAGYEGSPAANLVMDEIAVFRRNLTAEEVASLASAESGLFHAVRPVLCEQVQFPFFWRNQTNAEVRTALHSLVVRDATLEFSIGGKKLPLRRIRLPRGRMPLDIPFDPSRFHPGTLKWEMTLREDGGNVIFEKAGEVTVFPRRDRDEFKFFGWGGWMMPPDDFLHEVGINSLNVDVASPGEVRRMAGAGFFPNIRYECFRKGRWEDRDVDMGAIVSGTRRMFEPYRGLHVWTSTLVNSEVYGSRYPQTATNHPAFLALARRELGFEPDFGWRNAPIEVTPKTLGGPMPSGVIARGTCRQLDSLVWAMARGLSPYAVNRANAAAIHEVDPCNTVWSEPVFEGVASDLDMVAGWQYDWSVDTVLWHLRNQYAVCRAYGRPYQPTMDGAYYVEVWGRHPEKLGKDGKPLKIEMPQSLDEITVRAWTSISAVPAHSLGFFYADKWYVGERDGIVEPGTAKRFGRRWRERIAPAAELLRDMPNERAKVAVVLPSECRYASGIEWGQYHYPLAVGTGLARYGLAFDVVHDRELEAGALSRYRVAILPMARVLYEDHAEKIEEAAKAGCHVVTDAVAARRFPRGMCREKFSYRYKTPPVHDEIAAWYPEVARRLLKFETATSDHDGDGTSRTFLKESGGTKYVVVVNDARSPDRGFYGRFVTNEWFRVVGVPQRIRTRFRTTPGAAIYEFNAADGRGFRKCADENGAAELESCYDAAEGKVFCIYPTRLSSMTLRRDGEKLVVELRDVAGRLAPGAQVVDFEIRAGDGRIHDESGRYRMEGGRLAVPLRFADGETAGGWRAKARDLTSGFAAVAEF